MKKKLAISAMSVTVAYMGFYHQILMANSSGPGQCLKVDQPNFIRDICRAGNMYYKAFTDGKCGDKNLEEDCRLEDATQPGVRFVRYRYGKCYKAGEYDYPEAEWTVIWHYKLVHSKPCHK
ncbi:MAG: hypothetical protein NZM04_11165 [Methylacidiphilales bacterium]|nr:hypothetical protein [Candidatus Methylacidiphilales bacterium]